MASTIYNDQAYTNEPYLSQDSDLTSSTTSAMRQGRPLLPPPPGARATGDASDADMYADDALQSGSTAHRCGSLDSLGASSQTSQTRTASLASALQTPVAELSGLLGGPASAAASSDDTDVDSSDDPSDVDDASDVGHASDVNETSDTDDTFDLDDASELDDTAGTSSTSSAALGTIAQALAQLLTQAEVLVDGNASSTSAADATTDDADTDTTQSSSTDRLDEAACSRRNLASTYRASGMRRWGAWQ